MTKDRFIFGVRMIAAWRLLICLAIVGSSPAALAVDVRFSGFGDAVFGTSFGDPADTASSDQFSQYGDDSYPVNVNTGFGITGTDFVVIADMSDELRFLGEVNLQAARGGSSEIELDVERMFVDYSLSDLLNVQAGLYFTPIGYFNRFLYSRAWLMNSVQVPDLFEEELNLVPTHTVGVSLYGTRHLRDGYMLNYSFSVGNGRAIVPDAAVYARDPSRSKEYAVLVEWIVPGSKDSRLGLSGWTDSIHSVKVDNLGDVVSAATGEAIKLREIGVNPYIVYNAGQFSVLYEYIYSRQKDRKGNLGGQTFELSGSIFELAYHMDALKMHPYFRYDKTRLAENDGGPYLALREDGGDVTRVFVPEFDAVMVGVAYDRTVHNRIKLEYIRHLDGARDKHGIVAQTAYGF